MVGGAVGFIDISGRRTKSSSVVFTVGICVLLFEGILVGEAVDSMPHDISILTDISMLIDISGRTKSSAVAFTVGLCVVLVTGEIDGSMLAPGTTMLGASGQQIFSANWTLVQSPDIPSTDIANKTAV